MPYAIAKAGNIRGGISDTLASVDDISGSHAKRGYRSSSSVKEVPEEFLDPISCYLMTHPVVLPSGKVRMHALFMHDWFMIMF